MLDSCSLSTSTEWALWEWTPWASNMEHYYFGSALYNRAICFPGFSPFYSYLNEYPNNPLLQIYEMGTDVWSFATRLTASSAANYLYAFARAGMGGGGAGTKPGGLASVSPPASCVRAVVRKICLAWGAGEA